MVLSDGVTLDPAGLPRASAAAGSAPAPWPGLHARAPDLAFVIAVALVFLIISICLQSRRIFVYKSVAAGVSEIIKNS